jgi:hypothetical protein
MADKRGSKPGERRGGRQKGSKNKATLEREDRARQDLLEQAKGIAASGRKIVIAKDELLDLIPVVKGTVAEFQRAAIADGQGLPGKALYDRQAWLDFREWVGIYESICRHAAEFQSPRFKAIAVAVTPDPGAQQPTPMRDVTPTDKHGRERAANAAYLQLVKG